MATPLYYRTDNHLLPQAMIYYRDKSIYIKAHPKNRIAFIQIDTSTQGNLTSRNVKVVFQKQLHPAGRVLDGRWDDAYLAWMSILIPILSPLKLSVTVVSMSVS